MGNRHGLAEAASLDWQARAEAAEQTAQALQAQLDAQAQAWQAAFAFEQGYDSVTMLASMAMQEVENVRSFTRFLEFIDHLIPYFQQHPGLVTGEVHAQRRLAHLQQLRAAIVTRQATLQWQETKRQQAAATEAARAQPGNTAALD